MRYRLLAPVGVAGAIALAAWIPTVTSAAAATPSLPALSPRAVVAKALSADVKGFSGTVRWTANLGLPDLSSLTGDIGGQGGSSAFDPTSLLSGSHDISVWDAGSGEQRLALPGSLSEVDLVHNGSHLYYFDSATQKVTDYTGVGHSGRDATSKATGVELTPDQAAQKLLAGLGTSTTVTAASPVYVAGQASYQITLTPRTAASTVGAVTIAVDASNGMPLQVQVFPRGSKTPALSLGFTSVSFSVPSASNFAAPHGSSTVTEPISRALDSTGPGGPAAFSWRHAGPHGGHMFGHWHGVHQGAPPSRGQAPGAPAAHVGHPTTVGTDWTTVAVFDGGAGQLAGEVGKVSTPVTGSFGTAQLVSSSLLNALILPDGKVLVGFVTPSALEAAASSAG
jgi:hypothetical protein